MDVSVIIPVYNTEQYLANCVDSILQQDNVSLEIILVDDGSTDSSPSKAIISLSPTAMTRWSRRCSIRW